MAPNLSRRSPRKMQTRLAFQAVEASSSPVTISPARVVYQRAGAASKIFDLSSPVSKVDAENEVYPSASNSDMLIETPEKYKRDGRLPFKPLQTPVTSLEQKARRTGSNLYDGANDTESDTEMAPIRRPESRTPQSAKSSTAQRSNTASRKEADPSRANISNAGFMAGHKTGMRGDFNVVGGEASTDSSAEEEGYRDITSPRAPPPRKKPPMMRSFSTGDEGIEDESESQASSRVMIRSGYAVISSSESPQRTPKQKKMTSRDFIAGGSTYNAPVQGKAPLSAKSKRQNGSAKSTPTKSASYRECTTSVSDDGDESDVLPTPRSTKAQNKQKMALDGSDDLASESSRASTRSRQMIKTAVESDDSDDNFPDISQMMASSSRSRKAALAVHESDEDEVVVDRSSKKKVLPRGSFKRSKKDKYQSDDDADDDDDDDEPVLSSPLKRRRELVNIDSESDIVTSPLKRSRPDPKTPVKGKAKAKNAGPKRISRHQKRKTHRTAREKKMELLRRKRAGEKITELTSSDSSENEPQAALYDSDPDLAALSQFEDDEEGEDEGIKEVRRTLRPSNRNQDEDDDFIVADEDMPLGVPDHGLSEIPLEFTHQAHKPLKAHFKDAIEWMIQNKINPAFERRDPIYMQAFKKLDDEVRGYAASIYSSSVWKEAFTRALWARPLFSERDMLPGSEHGCDACGRGNHVATFEIQFEGKAYHNQTLEEVDDDDDDDDDDNDDDDDDDDNVDEEGFAGHEEDNEDDHDGEEEAADKSHSSFNSTGQSIPSQKTVWYVGRFCKANAATAHSLIHWKYNLNTWVIDTLKGDGELDPSQLSARDNWTRKKKSAHANRLVDEWEKNGRVRSLYRDFRNGVEAARPGKNGGRWGRD